MSKRIPERMCVICREMKPKTDLIRLVYQEDVLLVDPSGRKPGRGLYLCLDETTINDLFKPKRLEKLIRKPVTPENRSEVEATLRKLAAEKAAAEAKLNRPEIVTVDAEGRTVRRVPKNNN